MKGPTAERTLQLHRQDGYCQKKGFHFAKISISPDSYKCGDMLYNIYKSIDEIFGIGMKIP